MSIIPGIEIAAPERTETSSGSLRVAEALAGLALEGVDVPVDLGVEAVGELRRPPPPCRRGRRPS